MSAPVLDSPLEAVARAHGAVLVERDGRRVAAHYGSVAGETAVCLRSVGLADRCDRVTLAVRGAPAGLGAVRGDLTLVRCDRAAERTTRAALDGLVVADASDDYAALALVGPRARAVLAAAALDEATVIAGRDGYEVLVPRADGAAAWARLLRVGEPFGIACVGQDALDHLAVARR